MNDLEEMKRQMKAVSGKRPSKSASGTREPHTSIAKVEQDRDRQDSRAKGARFENQTAKSWSKWSGEHLRRTPQSGGWSNAKFGVTGDLVCDKKRWPFHIECFTGDTLVLTIDGYRQISNIKVGDKVMTHAGHWRRVTDVMMSKHALVDSFMSGASTEPIHVTRLHPVEQFDGTFTPARVTTHTSHLTRFVQHSVSTRKWMHTVTPPMPVKSVTPRTIIPSKIVLDDDLAYLLGLYIAEGHCTRDKVSWSFHRDERLLHSAVVEIVRKKFGVSSSIRFSKSSKACVVVACSTNLAATFKEWCNTGAFEKRLGWLVALAEPHAWRLLRGLFQGDGHVRADVASYVSVSKMLVYDIQALLFRLGIVSYVGVSRRGLYKVNVSRQDMTRFGENTLLPCRTPLTDARYDRGFVRDVPNRHRVYFRDPEVRKDVMCRTVYNLSVDVDETYIVQGNVVVHNCKAREGWHLDDLITGVRQEDERSVRQWWLQASTQCPEGKTPLLVFKRNRGPVLLMLRSLDWQRIMLRQPWVGDYVATFVVWIDEQEVVVVSQDSFLGSVEYNKGLRIGLRGGRA